MNSCLRRTFCAGLSAALVLGSLAGCSSSVTTIPVEDYATTTVLTYGDTKISLAEAAVLARSEQYYDEYMYTYYYGTLPWTYEYEDNVTMEMQVKEDVMASLLQTCVLMDHAEEYGVTLTDANKELIKTSAENFMSETDSAIIESSGATEELMEEVYTHNMIANLVWKAITDKKEYTFDESEYRKVAADYVCISDSYTSDDGKTNEETANDILARVKNGESLSDIVSADYSGLSSSDISYLRSGTDLSDLGQAVVAMATGESKVFYLEGTGYYVLYCTSDFDEESSNTQLNSLISTAKSEEFNSVYASWTIKDYKVDENAWGNIVFNGNPIYSSETTTAATTTAAETTTTAAATTAADASASAETTAASTSAAETTAAASSASN